MKIYSPPGATPIDPDSVAQLIPNLSTQDELNEWEAANIAKAMAWACTSKTLKSDLLSVASLRLLHEKMFNETWLWAGKFRSRAVNLGVAPALVQNSLGAHLGDVKYWLEQKKFPLDEIAIRCHHRLVKIHPFTNGNGRWSRLVADLLVEFNGGIRFSWGMQSLVEASKKRGIYLELLRAADATDDIQDLVAFARLAPDEKKE